MLNDRNWGKGERKQYFEGLTVVSLRMYTRWSVVCTVGEMVGRVLGVVHVMEKEEQ